MEAYKKPFVKAGKSAQIELLEKFAKGEERSHRPAAKSFSPLLKKVTVFGYYTSEIGIHKEMDYKGNVIQEQFSGYEAV